MTPPWRQWHRLTDDDSLRWSDGSQPITTPHFIQHLQRQLAADDEVTLWQQGEALVLAPLAERASLAAT